MLHIPHSNRTIPLGFRPASALNPVIITAYTANVNLPRSETAAKKRQTALGTVTTLRFIDFLLWFLLF